jgi:polyisoprenoid-binding protein YceI
MKNPYRILASFIFIMLFAGLTCAAPIEWSIDRPHSNIYFDIRHVFATVRGVFENFSGKVIVDKEKPEMSSVAFEVEVKSVNTGVTQRDNHLKTKDFFDEEKYPLMKFKSASVKHISGNKYVMKGPFTIKDVTKTIEIPFTYLGVKDNPSNPGEQVAGFEARFTINRFDYHVGDPKLYEIGLVDKDVNILITLELLGKK